MSNPHADRTPSPNPGKPRFSQEDRWAAAQHELESTFGHSRFRDLQGEIIQHVLQERPALVLMPTGMGKSLCYQIPAVVWGQHAPAELFGDRRPLTLVLSPLIALMKDQVDQLQHRGVRATLINSSLDRQQREQRYRQLAQGEFDLVYVAPERFQKPEFVDALTHRDVRLLAIDEAHCISQWGHDFRPDYTRVGEFRQQLGQPTTLALTATATPEVQTDILRQLGLLGQARVFHAGIDRPNLELSVVHVWDDDDKLQQIQSLRQQQPGSAIVYFNLIRKLSEFSDRLLHQGMPHLVYHGDLDARRRRDLQEQFMAEPDHLVLATNAFGMGVDKEDIRFVLHADLPASLEAYYQEIGRAGRDGLPAVCRLLYDQRDLATQMEFIQWSNPDAGYYRRLYERVSEDAERVNAYGLEWLREQLQPRQGHDRRLETALGMLFRWDVLAGDWRSRFQLKVVAPLPAALGDPAQLQRKLEGDQRKLLTMVEYARLESGHREFIADYFRATESIDFTGA